MDDESFYREFWLIYDEVCHWNVRCMRVPTGSIGKAFVSELSDLFRAFGESAEPVALVAAFIVPKLLLQSPLQSRNKEKKDILEAHLRKWREGKLECLVEAGRVIKKFQRRKRFGSRKESSSMARSFANLMFEGKVDAALKLVSDHSVRGGIMHMGDILDGKSVRSILRDKHPSSYAVNSEVLSSHEFDLDRVPLNVIFDSLDAEAVRRAAVATKGAGGPDA